MIYVYIYNNNNNSNNNNNNKIMAMIIIVVSMLLAHCTRAAWTCLGGSHRSNLCARVTLYYYCIITIIIIIILLYYYYFIYYYYIYIYIYYRCLRLIRHSLKQHAVLTRQDACCLQSFRQPCSVNSSLCMWLQSVLGGEKATRTGPRAYASASAKHLASRKASRCRQGHGGGWGRTPGQPHAASSSTSGSEPRSRAGRGCGGPGRRGPPAVNDSE